MALAVSTPLNTPRILCSTQQSCSQDATVCPQNGFPQEHGRGEKICQNSAAERLAFEQSFLRKNQGRRECFPQRCSEEARGMAWHDIHVVQAEASGYFSPTRPSLHPGDTSKQEAETHQDVDTKSNAFGNSNCSLAFRRSMIFRAMILLPGCGKTGGKPNTTLAGWFLLCHLLPSLSPI